MNFRTGSTSISTDRVPYALNSVLPPDVRVIGCDEKRPLESARYDAWPSSMSTGSRTALFPSPFPPPLFPLRPTPSRRGERWGAREPIWSVATIFGLSPGSGNAGSLHGTHVDPLRCRSQGGLIEIIGRRRTAFSTIWCGSSRERSRKWAGRAASRVDSGSDRREGSHLGRPTLPGKGLSAHVGEVCSVIGGPLRQGNHLDTWIHPVLQWGVD